MKWIDIYVAFSPYRKELYPGLIIGFFIYLLLCLDHKVNLVEAVKYQAKPSPSFSVLLGKWFSEYDP